MLRKNNLFQMGDDLDSTQALLDSTVATPRFVDSVYQDESEEEIFFGEVSTKEQRGKNSKCTRIQRNEQIRKTNLFQKSAAFDINKSDSKKEDKTTKITYKARQKSS